MVYLCNGHTGHISLIKLDSELQSFSINFRCIIFLVLARRIFMQRRQMLTCDSLSTFSSGAACNLGSDWKMERNVAHRKLQDNQ